jgi:hypothetical protein
MTAKKPASDAAKRKLDDKLDEALKDSFPSSDPIAISEPAPGKPDDKDRKSADGTHRR